jgi:cytidylate kinase
MQPPATITISRQLGSGGSYLGQKLAAALDFRYVDREVLQRATAELGASEELIARREERVQAWWERVLDSMGAGAADWMYVPPPLPALSDHGLFAVENRIMVEMALADDCVFIGRGGFRVLPPSPRKIDLFIHAPAEYRARRVMVLYGTPSEEEARAIVAESDLSRHRFVAEMCDADWTDAGNYHLAVDSSRLSLDKLAARLTDFVREMLVG